MTLSDLTTTYLDLAQASTQYLEIADAAAREKYWRNPLGDSKTLVVKPDYDKLSAYYNYDNGTGKILGVYLQENYAAKPIFEEWIKPLQDLGVTHLTMRNTHETDHNPFDWIGLPGFQFIQDEIDYSTRIHHTNQDVYDHCLPEDLIQSVIVMACILIIPFYLNLFHPSSRYITGMPRMLGERGP
jgi:hypothetical protein